MNTRRLSSLDRHTKLTCDYDRPDRFQQLADSAASNRFIARGAGLSYAGASFSENSSVLDVSRFDRIIDFDGSAGWVEVEGGVSLGKLFEFLTPRGFHVPVLPGHPQITVGGCVAANVHGKNQFSEGVFGRLVQALILFHPDHGTIRVSAQENPEVFDLTVGGYGLTGFIMSARLTIEPLPGKAIREERVPVANLLEAFKLVDRLKADHDMIYCWNDLARLGKDAGRGFVVTGKYVTVDQAEDIHGRSVDGPEGSPTVQYKRLDPSAIKRRPNVFSNRAMPWVNRLYYRMNTRHIAPITTPLFKFLFPAVGKEFYFDYFGDRGFIELQVLLPAASIEQYVAAFLTILRRHGQPIALATIKAFHGTPHLLHFNGSGFNFTIEVAHTPGNMALLADLDELNCEYGGITNIIKDSRLSASVARRQYPAFDTFRERLHAYDPARRIASSLSERLAL